MEQLSAQKNRTKLTMGMKRRDFLVLTIGGTVAAVVPSPPAYGAKLGSVKFSVASVDPYSSPIYVADKMGYWKDEGLEVEYFDSQSGPRSKQMLAAKQIFATSTGMNDVVALSLAGKPSVVVLGIDNRVTFANILVSKKLYDAGVKSVSDLAGRSIAVTQPQAATWLMAVYITERAGLKDKVTIRGLGDFTTMMGAVKSGTVDACTATVSMINKAREEGWGVPIFDVTETEAWNKVFGGDITGVCVWVLRETLEKSADQMQALVSGVVRGTDFVRDHSPEGRPADHEDGEDSERGRLGVCIPTERGGIFADRGGYLGVRGVGHGHGLCDHLRAGDPELGRHVCGNRRAQRDGDLSGDDISRRGTSSAPMVSGVPGFEIIDRREGPRTVG
jgi:NitT/TauT family transport system substrate-binding protein